MCNMTRSHFQFIADTLKDIRAETPPYRQSMVDDMAKTFAKRLPRTNSGFKPDRFLKACGVEP